MSTNLCNTCHGTGHVPDRSGNMPDGSQAGPFIDRMECPTCQGHGNHALKILIELLDELDTPDYRHSEACGCSYCEVIKQAERLIG